jgi:hypothetical protein
MRAEFNEFFRAACSIQVLASKRFACVFGVCTLCILCTRMHKRSSAAAEIHLFNILWPSVRGLVCRKSLTAQGASRLVRCSFGVRDVNFGGVMVRSGRLQRGKPEDWRAETPSGLRFSDSGTAMIAPILLNTCIVVKFRAKSKDT